MELWGFEPQTSCMPYTFRPLPDSAGQGPAWCSPAATLAVRRPAWPDTGRRWLPTWLPRISLASLMFDNSNKVMGPLDRVGRRSTAESLRGARQNSDLGRTGQARWWFLTYEPMNGPSAACRSTNHHKGHVPGRTRRWPVLSARPGSMNALVEVNRSLACSKLDQPILAVQRWANCSTAMRLSPAPA